MLSWSHQRHDDSRRVIPACFCSFLQSCTLTILIKSYPDQRQGKLKDERPALSERCVPNQVSLIKAARWHIGQVRSIGEFKPEGSCGRLKVDGHRLKRMVSAEVVMVGADTHLALFTDVADPDVLRQERIDAVQIEEAPFEFGLKGSP